MFEMESIYFICSTKIQLSAKTALPKTGQRWYLNTCSIEVIIVGRMTFIKSFYRVL